MRRCCDGLGELNGEAGDLQLPKHRLLHSAHLGLSAKRDDSHLYLGFPRPLGEEIVQSVTLAVRTGNRSQAIIIPISIDQIIHQEKLGRDIGITNWRVPLEAVLMPEKRRGSLRWFSE